MAPEIISTTRGVANQNSLTYQVAIDEKISQLWPDMYPINVITANMKNREVTAQPTFNHLEDEPNPEYDAAAGAVSAAATTINVAQGTYWRANDIGYIPRTGEQFTVVSVSSNALTVTRSWGATAAAVINDGDVLLNLMNAAEQGADKGSTRSTKKVTVTNYTGITRGHPFGFTGTAAASKAQIQDPVAYERAKQLKEALKINEKKYLWGQKRTDTSGTDTRNTTGGLRERISTNVYDANGSMTKSEFMRNFIEKVFRFDKGPKFFTCGARLISVLDILAGEKMTPMNKDKVYGLTVREWITSHGRLLVHNHPLLGETWNTGSGFALNMADIKIRYLAGREMILKTNVETVGADKKEDEYISETGIQINQEKHHGYIYNVNG